MGIKLSNSGINTFFECPKAYELKYVRKLANKFKGSALFFGSAIDTGLNYMTIHRNEPDVLAKSILEFKAAWEQGKDHNKQPMDLPKNPFIIYSKSDFDYDLLDKKDWAELFKMRENPLDERKRIYEIIQESGYPSVPEKDRMFYGYSTWLCLMKKGELLIKAYHDRILPIIEDVVVVQKDVQLKDGDSDDSNAIRGVVDLVVRFKDGAILNGEMLNVSSKENVVTDNKTSSVEYEQDSVAGSQQLALYKTLLNVEDPALAIKKGAYIVLGKKLEKDTTKTCKSCGHIATGSHKTCDAEIDGKRCNGVWDKKTIFKVNTNVIIDNISDTFSDSVIENFDTVVKSIEHGLFPRNYNSCHNKYGGLCDFFNICNKGTMTDIVETSPEVKVEVNPAPKGKKK